MERHIRVNIYGDSVMRGTVIDADGRYHAMVNSFLEGLAERYELVFRNRSHFGITIEKGLQILQRDIQRGIMCDYALIEFGGNDCSFVWNEVGDNPEGVHDPLTDLERYEEVLREMVALVRQMGAQPVLMTLPPVDGEKHLRYIGRDAGESKRILRWLGDAHMIYRFHELYSAAVTRVANALNCLFVDARARFLSRHDFQDLIGEDGVHPSEAGYALVRDTFDDFLRQRREMQQKQPLGVAAPAS